MNGQEGNDRGIIPRCVESLLESRVELSASFIEIYNEKIFDLLDSSPSNTPLDLREGSGKDITVAGLSSVGILNNQDFLKYQSIAKLKRTTAATNLNQESSRSHYILLLNLRIKKSDKILTSKLHLIDLAGSEDNKRTGNSGKRMNESCAINKSLFVLGQVVEALNKKSPRIPYRESKITRFLQDSLGGNAIGVIVACCSPSENVVTVNEVLAPEKSKSNERMQALAEWKNKKQKLMPTRNSTEYQSSASSSSEMKAERITNGQKKPRQSTDSIGSLTNAEIEEEINTKVEERVAIKIQELTDTLFSTKKFQDAVTDRFTAVEKRLVEKLYLATQANNTKENRDGNIEIETLKESTENDILFLLNNGNLKALMGLKMIGKKRAEAILEARNRDGQFAELSDLTRAGLKPTQISGIFKVSLY